MMKNPLEIQHWNGSDWQEHPFEKVILPLGSLENHGRHLPFATDALTAYLIAMEIAAQIPGMAVLPPLNYGASDHYRQFSFTVSLQFDTEVAVLKDILESVYREGVRKVFIMNGHDGNIAPIELASRSVKVAHPEIKIVSMDAWWNLVRDVLPDGFFEVWDGLGHAGEGETSMSLALFPELCDLSKAAGVVPDLPPYVDIKWTFDELTDKGASGDPTKGSREKGLKMKEVLVSTLVRILKDLDAADWDYRSPALK
jgi:creatinine amidohydrolase